MTELKKATIEINPTNKGTQLNSDIISDANVSNQKMHANDERGDGTEVNITKNIPSITFMYTKYTNLGKLAEALGKDWVNGKKRLYRSTFRDYFRNVNQDIANYCIEAENIVRRDQKRKDIEFFCFLYKMYPQLKSFQWKEYYYVNMEELGQGILDGLRSGDHNTVKMLDEFIHNHLFSQRELIVHRQSIIVLRQVYAIEKKYCDALQAGNSIGQLTQLYMLGYLYSKSRELVTSFGCFESIQALTDFVKKAMKGGCNMLDRYAGELILHKENSKEQGLATEQPSPEFQAWLIVQGKSDEFD
jgi:hypothetical protein